MATDDDLLNNAILAEHNIILWLKRLKINAGTQGFKV